MAENKRSRGHHGEHQGREDLTGEHRLGDAGQAAFAVLFAVVYIVDSFFLRWTTFLNEIVPLWVQLVIGIPLLIAAGYLALVSMKPVFEEVRDPPVVIRTGLYAWMRHPMYLSEVLLYVGLLALSLSLAAAAVWLLAIVFLFALCRYEEKLLIERFGDDYRAYMREVPMWLPRPWRRARTSPE